MTVCARAVLVYLLTIAAHAQRGLRYLVCHSVCPSVCLSVCYHVFSRYAQQDGQKAIPTGSVPHWLYYDKNAAFESYGVKQSEGSNMQISTVLPRPRPLALCILKAQEVTTKGMYRLPHVIYYCSYPVPDSPRATSGIPRVKA